MISFSSGASRSSTSRASGSRPSSRKLGDRSASGRPLSPVLRFNSFAVWRREALNPHVGIQEHRRDIGTGQQVADVVVAALELLHLLLELVVDRGEFLVQGLQFFLGCLQFLVGGLQLLVGGHRLFVGCLELLVGALQLFDAALQLLARGLEFELQLLRQRQFRRRRGGGRRVSQVTVADWRVGIAEADQQHAVHVLG